MKKILTILALMIATVAVVATGYTLTRPAKAAGDVSNFSGKLSWVGEPRSCGKGSNDTKITITNKGEGLYDIVISLVKVYNDKGSITFTNVPGTAQGEGVVFSTNGEKLTGTVEGSKYGNTAVMTVEGKMLGEQLCDPAGEESGTPCTLRGLGLLPTTTVFGTEKHLTQTAACVTTEPFAGAKLTGYEIHAGRTEVRGSAFCILADGTPEGCVQDGVFGTYLHGLFDTGELTEKLTAFLCKRKGINPAGAELIPMEQYRQQQFDLLADGVRAALDMPAIYAAMGMQKGDNT